MNPFKKKRVGIVGATGYVGQRLLCLLDDHPYFEIQALIASPRSAGRTYEEVMASRWKLPEACPEKVKKMILFSADEIEAWREEVDFVFCAVNLSKPEVLALEEKIAKAEIPVISNNSAHRLYPDIPMIIPEINGDHLAVIRQQKQRLGTKRGFIVCKPNCSIQSYVPALHALRSFEPEKVLVSTYQAISGAGKTFETWPEMVGNLIPYIGGEEEKSETEPLKIWGKVTQQGIQLAEAPLISAQCYRVPVQEGHTASVAVSFRKKPGREEILAAWTKDVVPEEVKKLPSEPDCFLQYLEDENRPQVKLDVNTGHGMTISIGRLREDKIFDYKFVCLSHNTFRGAAGGALLTAEYLSSQGFL